MDYVAIQIATISVMSPLLLGAGILYLISTANIGIPTIALNLMATAVGGLRFAGELPECYHGIWTVFFLFFMVLAYAANIRICIPIRSSLVKIWKSSRVKESTISQVPNKKSSQDSKKPKNLEFKITPKANADPVQILSPTSWSVNNKWGDIKVFTAPQDIIEKNQDLLSSPARFRIIYDEELQPIEDVIQISKNSQIMLPPNHTEKLKGCDLIRFEILK